MKKVLRIFAFGGNEVSPTGITDPKTGKSLVPDIAMQWQKTADTTRLVADILEKHPRDLFVLTHGNGPQVGNILLRSEHSRSILHPIPLDICGADTQGAMAYMLAQLNSELAVRGIAKKAAGLVTQVVVNKDDPGFQNPTKYVGPAYSRQEAEDRRDKNGWAVKCYKKNDKGEEVWRKVVPSPDPVDIVEIEAVEALLDAGLVPITVGGGGIPVVETECQNGEYRTNYDIVFKGREGAKVYRGVEAVIDKDLASALLGVMLLKRARARGSELDVSLTVFTGEDGAKLNYQKPDQIDLRRLTVKEAQDLYDKGNFPAGSMGPKIKAALEFVKNGGSVAYISKTELFEETLRGKAGTTIVP
ncbi:MAG: carbamate kinase [Elusimicrobiaceae bacterium]|nr:carbamate kinase [Elusimicrobiaceae bacterium]